MPGILLGFLVQVFVINFFVGVTQILGVAYFVLLAVAPAGWAKAFAEEAASVYLAFLVWLRPFWSVLTQFP